MTVQNDIYGGCEPLGAILDYSKVSINGMRLFRRELKGYVAEHEEEFSKEAVQKKISVMMDTMPAEELRNQKDIGCIVKAADTKDSLMMVGNPLAVAICLSEEKLIRGLMEKNVLLKDSELFSLNKGINVPGFLSAVILGNFTKLPEELWVALCEYYPEQSEKEQKATELGKLNRELLPETGRVRTNLLVLKEKYPQAYQKTITEDVFNRILWSLCEEECQRKWSKEKKKEVSQWLIKLNYPLIDQSLMWKLVLEKKQKAAHGMREEIWETGKRYLLLWKKLSGQKIVADMDGELGECISYELRSSAGELGEFFGPAPFLKCLLNCVDLVKNERKLDSTQVFQFFFKEGREEEAIASLRSNWISDRLLVQAFRYAEENNKRWVLPLLILKKHGEWAAEETYGE